MTCTPFRSGRRRSTRRALAAGLRGGPWSACIDYVRARAAAVVAMGSCAFARGRAATTTLGNIRASSFRESLLVALPDAERVEYEARFARRRPHD